MTSKPPYKLNPDAETDTNRIALLANVLLAKQATVAQTMKNVSINNGLNIRGNNANNMMVRMTNQGLMKRRKPKSPKHAGHVYELTANGIHELNTALRYAEQMRAFLSTCRSSQDPELERLPQNLQQSRVIPNAVLELKRNENP